MHANVTARSADPHFHPEPAPGSTTVVFDDHRFCAGRSTQVEVMAAPHMHSQFELNVVLEGAMTYWFDDRSITVRAGSLVLFWGMIPHRTVARETGTRFVCLYLPSALVLGTATCDRLRAALFGGAFVAAGEVLPTDAAQADRWRRDLLLEDPVLEDIVRGEVSARLRRLERDGWADLRETAATPVAARAGSERAAAVEAMARFIDENAGRPIDVAMVAASAGLNPNYAMGLFKRGIGQTVTQYVTRRRLDTAQALLVSTDHPIADIAFEAGFGSLSRFYEAFTLRFRMSPRSYRARHRRVAA
ncbi:MAG TPA: helix-turn-helix domain-containing protein [Microvirga sp.]|jgi:AraC-like DNA-binding protein|nr:helix-turn-helix domain-containing protein [Microvirga sp.]